MYIFVNEELTKSQRIPQACHAVAEYMHRFGSDKEVIDWVNIHRTMVVLKCPESDLRRLTKQYESASFVDDDLGDFITAIAIRPMCKHEEFSTYKLA